VTNGGDEYIPPTISIHITSIMQTIPEGIPLLSPVVDDKGLQTMEGMFIPRLLHFSSTCILLC
jgi:hypothetical protein